MSTESDNVDILRQAYALWGSTKAGSVEHWMGLMADRVDWRSLAAGAAGMEFTCDGIAKDDVRSYLETLAREWEMQSYTVDDFIAQGDRVVMVGRCAWKHRGTGKHVDTPKADIVRLRDGKIVEFMEYYDTAAALAATVA